MKLLKIKHIIPLSAAAITFVCSQSTAEASTIHTVKKNDTLWGISKRYDVSIQSIKQANHKGNDQTFIGEQLHIPGSVNSNETTVHQNAKPANISEQIIYQVQPGDSLETIAKRYNVTVQSIKQINNTVGNKLYAGQHLKINSSISEKEKDLMARLVTAEAGGESYRGKVAVAKVILNRVNANGFPNTITGVIYEPITYGYAFTPVTDGRINQPASAEAKMAVEEAISTNGIHSDWLYFYNPKTSTDKWITTRQTVAVIGNHVFAK
ncbi:MULTISPECIES: cell wall hydrolase [Bacillus]|uniref:Spore cortex-lytic enzyme n=1 Tax=Bacillus paranthracis TaxID=2026186 RepID=A0A9X8XA26_9BACI|nr:MULTISPECIES: cell wall hydrolase [Bacillus cereus group]ASZ16689.1 peptigoglycan-binding protein LysM [Bacillus cereus]MCH5435900.1 LysM peptidoglycan-binding domain-containing protein [Bacillus paranthracis]MCR6792255.1 LysM peptidoglycan-binding domain-containing protein [Bacillus paranthracis]MCU5174617.1 LysM peptidoglycan-binding domain-containing protein [Bacillus paranthracis]MCU5204049.1 LysM peptidoglycan-binding domain-containing protein [Bacillus paranthracis]